MKRVREEEGMDEGVGVQERDQKMGGGRGRERAGTSRTEGGAENQDRKSRARKTRKGEEGDGEERI